MLIDDLKKIVGPAGWVSDSQELLPHLTEWRDTWVGKTALMVAPSNVEQVSQIVRACAANGVSIVPQGGNTGLCGGAIPDESGQQVLLSLSRMNRIRSVSPDDFSICVEAGCVLADVQTAARDSQRLFPLSLGAEGSCQIGGNISTNAGGVNVIKYGTARDQVLGLEVVLADGSIWDGLRTLRKDTAGYDVKQLFIGSEGTLGIITAATLRLYPEPQNIRTAWIGIADAQDAVGLLSFLRDRLNDQLHAFELIPARAIEFVLKHIDSIRLPHDSGHPWYVLLDAAMGRMSDHFEEVLIDACDKLQLLDVVVAKNQAEADTLWRLRHSISEAQKLEGASLKHDISVPVGSISKFINQCEKEVLQLIPDARIVAFGHVGDGNVHFNATQPQGMLAADFTDRRGDIATLVYKVATAFGGSISAEHGIGVLKREHLREFRSETELNLMRAVRDSLDPGHILNPGKVL
jgi:FAD/FMN-containing dehydrogenase